MSTVLDHRPVTPRGSGLSLRNVKVEFGGNTVLDEVSLEVAMGERVALIGPNGAGKTTLVNVVSGTVQPQSGEVSFGGVSLGRKSPLARARAGLTRTFQNLEVFGSMTVFDNVLTARDQSHRRSRGVGNRRATQETVERVGLTQVAARPLNEVSYGHRKLTEIARALVVEPKLLLLDEPVAGLNSSEKQTVSNLLGQLFQEMPAAVLLIEHDMSTVEALAERVVVLDAGEVLTEGTFDEVVDHPQVVAAYLGRTFALRKGQPNA